jgi:2,5-diamino-6-(ribosylamino)-4(3H)-pyrimidinone 5'-phosphate reductase
MALRLIMHNSVSLDGRTTGFAIDPGQHYAAAARFRADAMLVGSRTARAGITEFLNEVPPEQEADRHKPAVQAGDTRPLWIIPDSTGSLLGLLHVFRSAGYCRDVVLLVASSTPTEYIEYLKERDYDFLVAGTQRVDLKAALTLVEERSGVRTVLTDSGGSLTGALLDLGLMDELSLLVQPVIAGGEGLILFRDVQHAPLDMQLLGREDIGSALWLRYRVLPRAIAPPEVLR